MEPREVVLAHVTDPHFGRADPAAIEALSEAIRALAPDLVIAGGDLTQRARSAQFRQARAFLDGLGAPWLAVPGNHDVPLYNLVLRVFGPLWGFHRHISEERAPRRCVGGVRVLGLDSTRRKVTGRLRPAQVAQIHDADVLVTHHPLVRRPLEGAGAALEAAERAGVDVLLAGHHHHTHVTPVGRERLAVEGPSPSHVLEAVRGFFVLRVGERSITAELWSWDGTVFAPGRTWTFDRSNRNVNRR